MFHQSHQECTGEKATCTTEFSGGCPLQVRADGWRNNHRILIAMEMMWSQNNKGQVVALNDQKPGGHDYHNDKGGG